MNSYLNSNGSRGLDCRLNTALKGGQRSAEIASKEGDYPGIGYYLITGNSMTSDYTYNHNTKVDGETKYGTTSGFPRRPVVGTSWNTNFNNIGGSRSMSTVWVTAYSGSDFSII